MKVLVIDDSNVIRNMVKFALTMKEHSVITANDGDEGIQIAREAKPDLILLDILMPKMNGYEACQILKNDPNTQKIPIFILSSKGQMEDLEKAFDAGADNYITKPFNPEKLDATIAFKLAKLNKVV